MKLFIDLFNLFIMDLDTLVKVVGEINYLRGFEVFFEFKTVASTFLLLHTFYRVKILIFESFHFLE